MLLGFLILFVVAVVVCLFLVLYHFLSKIVGTYVCFSLSQCVSASQTCKTKGASPMAKVRFCRFVFSLFCSTRNVNKRQSHSLNTKRTSRRNIYDQHVHVQANDATSPTLMDQLSVVGVVNDVFLSHFFNP